MIQGVGFRIQALGFRIWFLEFRTQYLGQGLGLRVLSTDSLTLNHVDCCMSGRLP